jgi:hypothetical protein
LKLCRVAYTSHISRQLSGAPLTHPEIKGTCQIGDEYSLYRDLRGIIELGKREIFIIDNYLDDQIFDIYVNRVANGLGVRMLTCKPEAWVRISKRARFAARQGLAGLKDAAQLDSRVL